VKPEYTDDYVEAVFKVFPDANFVAVDSDGVAFAHHMTPFIHNDEAMNHYFESGTYKYELVKVRLKSGELWKDSVRERDRSLAERFEKGTVVWARDREDQKWNIAVSTGSETWDKRLRVCDDPAETNIMYARFVKAYQ